jgi:AcrR family transcriptional regulator
MLIEVGYEAVTMRAIAERIEYTPTAIYHHFASKQALVTELCEADFRGLARSFHSAGVVADPIERLRAVGRAYLGFALQYPSQYRFMFMTPLPPLPHAAGTPEQPSDDPEHNAYVMLRQACADSIAQGRLAPEYDDPDMVAQIMWGIIHGLVSLRMDKNHGEYVPWRDLKRTVNVAVEATLKGMLRNA